MASENLAPKSSRFIAMASVCVVVAALYLARDVLVPIAMAVLLTFLLAPLVHRIERWWMGRVPAVMVVVLIAFMAIGGMGWLISSQVNDLANRISDYKVDIENKIEKVQHKLGGGALAKASRTVSEMVSDVTSRPSDAGVRPTAATIGTERNPLSVTVTGTPTTTQGALTVIADAFSIFAPLAQILIIGVLVIFMLVQREDLRDRLIRLVGRGQLTVTTQALDDAGQRVSSFLLAQSVINIAYGLLTFAGLAMLHIPQAALWGLIVGLLRFIPYLGIWIGAIFPVILSIVVPEGNFAARPLLTIAMFVGLEVVTANFAEPTIIGTRTGVSSLAILLSAVFWTWLWGPVGLFLSTPLTVVLAVMGKYVPQLQFLNVILGDQPVLRRFQRYYQRLLAEDPEEAEELLEESEKTSSTEELYAEILLPALELAQRDHRRGVLDTDRRQFIRQAMRDEIDRRREKKEKESNPVVPRDRQVTVLLLPASDESDEIAAHMLGHLLETKGFRVQTIGADTLASEMVDVVAKMNADLVFVSALPPGAMMHARYLCKRVHAKYPEMPLVICLWGYQGDMEKAKQRVLCDGQVQFARDLEGSIAAIYELAKSAMASEKQPEPKSDTDST